MSAALVARQYGHAAFAVARKVQRADIVGRELQAFADLVVGHPDLRKALESATVPRQAKRDLVAALLERTGPVTDEVRRLLDLLGDNDRLALVGAVAEAYAARAMEADGVMTADVVTALPLGDERQEVLAQALSQATGRRVIVTGRVDESLIGGVIAHVGGVVYDGSVTRQLERMRQRLSAEG